MEAPDTNPISIPSPAQVAKRATSSSLYFPPEAIKDAEKWGYAEGGMVYVRDGGASKQVGLDNSASSLSFYATKYLRLMDRIKSFSSSLDSGEMKNRDILSALKAISSAVEDPKVVGDLGALRSEFKNVKAKAEAEIEKNRQKRSELIAKSVDEHKRIAEKAEGLLSSVNDSTNWKQMGDEFQELFEEWKRSQRSDAKSANKEIEELWSRFMAARSEFNRRRKEWVKGKIAKKNEAKAKKEKIAQRAESLAASTDWERTSREFRRLMDEWRNAGRPEREDDDALWARFKAASDSFYQARNRQDREVHGDEEENLKAKLDLLEEAEKLVPIKSEGSLKEVRSKLSDIERKWDAIGPVPRDEMRRCEERMRKVEEQVKASEMMEWKRTDPRTADRKQSLANQIESRIAMLDKEISKAEGEMKKKLEEEREEKEIWLKAIQEMKD